MNPPILFKIFKYFDAMISLNLPNTKAYELSNIVATIIKTIPK